MLLGSALVASACTLSLLLSMVNNDLSLAYVADHTRPGVSMWLKGAGLWAGPEGSLLLWVAMVAWAAVVAVWYSNAVWVLRSSSALVAGYGLTLVLTASPFVRLAVPVVGGLGLQPVLEHPALVWHPPLLYAGLTSMLVPGLLAMAPPADPENKHSDNPGFKVPLIVLGAGLITGAMWANTELGWGGYWAWDPIESAGLVVWLVAAAALHHNRPEAVPALVMAPGVAAVWATTLTRIGVVSSVHAFVDRPPLRIGLLVVAGVATVVVVARLWVLGTSSILVPWTRAFAVAILVTAAGLVALGTYEPLIEAATTGDAVGIAGRYFARVLWPVVMLAGVAAVWADRSQCQPRWLIGHTSAVVIGALAAVSAIPARSGLAGMGVAAAGGMIAASAIAVGTWHRHDNSGWGRSIAHVGVGVLLVGVAGTMATRTETVVADQGQTQNASDQLEVIHQGIVITQTSSVVEAKATLLVDGIEMHPRLVSYPLRSASSVEADSLYRLTDQIQVVLLDGDDHQALYRVSHLPRLALVWLGAAIVIIGLAWRPRRSNKTISLLAAG